MDPLAAGLACGEYGNEWLTSTSARDHLVHVGHAALPGEDIAANSKQKNISCKLHRKLLRVLLYSAVHSVLVVYPIGTIRALGNEGSRGNWEARGWLVGGWVGGWVGA